VGDSWLHEVVCRHTLELWVTVGNMKLCVDRDMKLVYITFHYIRLHEAVF